MRRDIRPVTVRDINITGGFWKEKQELVRNVTMKNVYDRFKETGRFEAFHFTWKEGEPNKPHVFWDSDVAKWIEAVGYFCLKQRDPELEAIVDDVVDAIEQNRMKDGYFNSYYGLIEPENRFTQRKNHELYCAGHLLEGAIAYMDGTGKDKLFRLMKDYIDLIYQIFYIDKSAKFTSPGHEEIELALVKLYRVTGEKKYLDLALYFVEQRGLPLYEGTEQVKGVYIQDHLPIRAQKTADGHAVRACYLYCAVADLAKETGDETLFDTTKTIFENIVRRRMYVTGAIGQNVIGEAFSGDYDLPNITAYAETCANLSLSFFARRLSVMDPDAVYADTAERVLYNSFLSGLSLDGRAFFYSNMQESNGRIRRANYGQSNRIFSPADQRVEVFSCSCCPPNVVRAIASVADYGYMTDGETVWVQQYFSSDVRIGDKSLTVKTGYPYDGEVRVSYHGESGKLAFRIPGWCRSYSLTKNGKEETAASDRGYVYLSAADGDEFVLTFDMPVSFVEANPRVWEDAGRVAVMRGPIVYCMEAVDNAHDEESVFLRDLRLDEHAEYRMVNDETLGIPVLETIGFRRKWDDSVLYAHASELMPCSVRLIPYFAMANRGSTDMLIWTLKV